MPRPQPSAQRDAQLAACDGIERGKRFVEEKGSRVPRQRTRQRYPLALASGQPRRKPSRQIPDTESLEPFGGPVQPLLAREPGESEHRVPHHVEMREERVVLREIGQLPLLDGDVDPRHVIEEHLSVESDSPRVRREDAEKKAQERGLAGSVGPCDQHRLAAERQIDAQVELADPARDGDLKHRAVPRRIVRPNFGR